MPWIVQPHEDSFCVHLKNEDGSVGEMIEGGCHATETEAQAHARALYAQVGEMYSDDAEHDTETMADGADDCMKRHMADGMTEAEASEACKKSKVSESTNGGQLELISEIGLMETRMQKGFPDIPLVAGVSLDEIKQHDPNPTFVTLQIAEIGRTSRENIYYDEPLVNVIEQHIITKRPGGIFGHPNPDNIKYEYPEPQALWVGAKRQGNVLWGKAWIRDPQSARRVRDTGLVGGSLATSIWGLARRELQDGAIRLKDFLLERIDFAPPERASLPLSGQFALTAEMTSTGGTTVTIEELKAELAKHAADVVISLITPETYTQISEMVVRKNTVLGQAGEQQLISEMSAQIDTANTLIAEMTKERDELRDGLKSAKANLFEHDVDATVRWATDWNTVTEKGKSTLKALRSYLKKGLIAEMKAGEPLQDAMDRVMNDADYKPVIEMTKKEIGGGALTSQAVDQRAAQYSVPTDDQIADARARTGI